MNSKIIGKTNQDVFSKSKLIEKLKSIDMEGQNFDLDVSNEEEIKISNSKKIVIEEGKKINKEDLLLLISTFDIFRGKYKIVSVGNGKFEFYRSKKEWIQKEY